jgi:outer membrane protein TolC
VAFCLALALFLLLPAGCVNQRHEVQTYRDVLDADLPQPKSYSAGEPLTLERALALANRDNENIAYQGETYLQALIAKNRALAAFLPTVSLQPSFTLEQNPSNGASSAAPISGNPAPVVATAGAFVGNGNVVHRLEVPVVGTMSLNPPYAIANVQSADQIIIQQRQLLLDAQQTILLNVAQAHYQILRSEEQVAVLRQSLEVDQARLRDVEGRLRNHLALALEVSQTRSLLAGTAASLTQAQIDVRNGRRTLAYLLGLGAVDGPLVDDVVVPRALPPVEYFRQKAAATRPDLLAAAALVRAQRLAVDAAIAEYYPTVSLNVAGFLYREQFSSASKWDAILLANIPIFSAGIIEADVRSAWSRLRQAALYQSNLQLQIDQNVQTAYDNLASSGEVLGDLREQVQAASDSSVQSQQLFANGLAIPLDVLTAQETLLNAQLSYTSEKFDRTVFYLNLLRASGELTPKAPSLWRAASTNPSTVPTTAP